MNKKESGFLKMEILAECCGSPFWIDQETMAANNSRDVWCPYCKKYIGIEDDGLEVCHESFDNRYKKSHNSGE